MNSYYKILDLKPGATDAEIKKAYRRKAFEFHPDRNKTPGAHEKFIEITIAYEVLLSGKQVFTQSSYSSTTYTRQTSPAPDSEAYKKWQQQAKERAEAQAKRRYEEFKKKNEAFKRRWYFPIIQLLILLSIFACGSLALLFFSIPVWVFIREESESWPMSLLSLFWTLPGVWLAAITKDIWEIYRTDF